MSARLRRSLLLALALLPCASIALDAGAADIRERKVKFSYVNAKGHPQDLGAVKFAERVAAKSGGRIKVATFAGGVLGGDLQTVSALQGGTIEMTVLNAGLLATQVKEMAVFDLPFLFSNADEADAVADGPIGRKLLAKLADKGLIGLAYWDLGFRNLTNSKRPVARLEDIAGLKIRVVQSPIYIDLFNALGANATPMAFTEVYTALESKALDGQETPYNIIYTSRFYEVQKYLSATRHIYGPGVVLVGRKFWDQLSGDEKKVLQDSCTEARDVERKASHDLDQRVLTEMKAKGLQFNDITPAERARMRDAVKPVVEKYTAVIGADLVKQAYAEIERVRKQP